MNIMAFGPITSWQIDGETMETVRDFILGGSKITADDDYSHEIKRCLLVWTKAMTNLDSILKTETLLAKTAQYNHSSDFSCCHVWMWQLRHKEWWAMKNCCFKKKKKKERKIVAFELRCWTRLLRNPWTARRSNQSMLKEINPVYSMEALNLNLKLQYFGQLL